LQVFLVRKIKGSDTGRLYAMKVLKKATLKGRKYGWTVTFPYASLLENVKEILRDCRKLKHYSNVMKIRIIFLVIYILVSYFDTVKNDAWLVP